ncbi:hypothetical protein TSUD_311270 [Trifolium subterraneum]|uniref:F-box domain-containing protein n=1 Tax=Trifolium subterraneum TaxID=3900 RepID=A0A2Z6MBY5_TRISU|nr:hypothetical protein TSUD_311270 [Trifolium subterraneum]
MSTSSSHHHRSIPTEDRISSLPDSILSHILSFLPTKSSAATSILSKRWKSLWLSVLDLHFNGESFSNDYTTVRHVLFLVMLSREVSLPIRSLSLHLVNCRGVNINDINCFVNAVLNRGGIQTLELMMDIPWTNDHLVNKLSINIFNCKTLTVLKLRKLRLIDLPHQVHIPLLKILHLDSIMFKNYKEIIKFLLGCPILEDLQTYTRLIPGGDNPLLCSIPSGGSIPYLPNLVRASIYENVYIPFFLFSGAKILRINMMFPLYIQVPIFHNLIHLEIFFCNFKGKTWDEKWMWMLEMLQHSPNLQHLTLRQEVEDGIDDNNWQWQDHRTIPKCLSSQLRTCLLREWRDRKCDLQFAEYVMQNSKVLRTMTIHSASSADSNAKHQMLKKLAVCPRSSSSCKLIFDG